jgi:ABC-2 type transport system ATP-binding protein
VIKVEELRAGYPTGFRRTWRDVLSGVSFHVPKGSITGYLGVNGAGKTTTIKIVVGVNPPSGGTVMVGGHPSGSDAAQRLVGYFPEAPFFYDALSGVELLGFFARINGIERAERTKRAEALLEEVGLGDSKDVPINGYSKGMRQRLGLAQALIHEPELLVLDEPLDGLDPMGRLHLRNLIVRQREQGRTVFFSSHVLSDVEAVSDRLVVLDGGKVAYDGLVEGITAGSPCVDVVLEASPDAIPDLEQAAGVKLEAGASREAGRRRFEALCQDSLAADRLVTATLQAQGRVDSIVPRRATLEEVFLQRFGEHEPKQQAEQEGEPS